MNFLKHAPSEYQRYFVEGEGVEHYRLLERLSSELEDGEIIVDVGTLYGLSALALASNPKVEVWTYDIQSFIPNEAAIKTKPNISFRIKDGIEAIPDFVHKTKLIMLDVDPHDGEQERRFIQQLVKHSYVGRVVCDDIHLNDAMKAFWESVTQRKEVRSDGHFSGTGIIYFE